ncbi:MAG: ferritin-like domain-containing protein, partial [Bacteroidota bacterium]
SSSSHRPRSIVRHRSLQKGKALDVVGSKSRSQLETYLEQSNIKSVKDESNDKKIVETIVENLKQLIEQENKVKKVASDAGDSETEDMMIALVNSQEKTNWMFSSWLGN